VKLVLDENLSPRLVPRLLSLFPELIHVRQVGLQQAGDGEIWDWAKTSGYSVITADSDFVRLSRERGWPPKVIHLERCDFAYSVIEDTFGGTNCGSRSSTNRTPGCSPSES
jgi:predicted nuclease of predicted toxin-antitoxin system